MLWCGDRLKTFRATFGAVGGLWLYKAQAPDIGDADLVQLPSLGADFSRCPNSAAGAVEAQWRKSGDC